MHYITPLFVCLLLISGASPNPAKAQQAETMELSDSGRDYLETVGRRVNPNVAYFNPDRAAPELTTTARPTPARDRGDPSRPPVSNHVFTAIAVIVLAGVAFQIWRSGSPVSVSLRSRPKDAARALRASASPDDPDTPVDLPLSDILKIGDRNLALVELARKALSEVASRNGMHWQTSWTARDLLRRLPRDAGDGLRPLVRTAEHVQFGDRTVGEDEFQAHAEDVRRLLGGAAG